jgi:hypothetical protein
LQVTFEFGETESCREFLNGNPEFLEFFDAITKLGNKCLGPEMKPANELEDIAFGMGNACRDDFLEVAFLAINGYGFAASKLLRGLYERAVALAYLTANPDKTARLVRFAAIQEHRAMEAALRVVAEEEFNKVMGPDNSAQSIRERYEKVRPEFLATLCKKCRTTRVQANWDLDVASMAAKVRKPYSELFVIAYTIPNFHIHATLASASSTWKNDASRIKQQQGEAQLSLFAACHLFLLVIRSQSGIFSMRLDSEIEACEAELVEWWQPHLDSK